MAAYGVPLSQFVIWPVFLEKPRECVVVFVVWVVSLVELIEPLQVLPAPVHLVGFLGGK
jgi:hypothetical protein